MAAVILLLAAAVSTADATLLAERLAGNGYGAPPVVTAGALPPNWTPPVPLPDEPLIGSVERVSERSVELLYAPKNGGAAFSGYEVLLLRDGYAPGRSEAPGFTRGGFVRQNLTSENELLCRGAQGVTLRLLPGDDLRLNVLDARTPAMLNPCSPSSHSPQMMLSGFGAVPVLRVPDGVTVTPDTIGGASAGFGASGVSTNVTYGARFDGNTSVAQLFGAFVAQMKHAGWIQDAAAHSQTGAFGGFHREIDGQQWRSQILVYAADPPQTFRGLLVASGVPLTKPLPASGPQLPRIPADAPHCRLRRRPL